MVMGQRKCPAEETTMTSMHRVHPAVSFASLYFGHASVTTPKSHGHGFLFQPGRSFTGDLTPPIPISTFFPFSFLPFLVFLFLSYPSHTSFSCSFSDNFILSTNVSSSLTGHTGGSLRVLAVDVLAGRGRHTH